MERRLWRHMDPEYTRCFRCRWLQSRACWVTPRSSTWPQGDEERRDDGGQLVRRNHSCDDVRGGAQGMRSDRDRLETRRSVWMNSSIDLITCGCCRALWSMLSRVSTSRRDPPYALMYKHPCHLRENNESMPMLSRSRAKRLLAAKEVAAKPVAALPQQRKRTALQAISANQSRNRRHLISLVQARNDRGQTLL